jgi:MFS family permease
MPGRAGPIARLNPFKTPETRRLAVLFGVVYFAQGMWSIPDQAITMVLKDEGFKAGEVATFFLITTFAWNVKPVYGLLSDFVPLFGSRRRNYFLLTTASTAAAGLTLALREDHPYGWLVALVGLMGAGLAFTDVLTDALMVEAGRARRLTGAFQAVQWAAGGTARLLVGVVGGWLARHRDLRTAFGLATCFPVVSFAIILLFVRDAPARFDRAALLATWRAIRDALRTRTIWLVAGFIFFYAFSPSFGTALTYYQKDVLGFSEQLIGNLRSIGAAGAIVGAAIYAPLSRRRPLKTLIVAAIGLSAGTTLAYTAYVDVTTAVVVDAVTGCVGMLALLSFLDLAARACPRGVEATFFALLMSVYNVGIAVSDWAGGHLYDWLGLQPMILISAALTALAWALVPVVGVDRIEAAALAREDA